MQEGRGPLDEDSGAWETNQMVLDSDKNSENRAKNETINKDIAETNPTKMISVKEISKILTLELNQGNGKMAGNISCLGYIICYTCEVV
jgi:hypothetical protein